MGLKEKQSATKVFGDAAESYVGSLYGLRKIPNGNRMPDLTSKNQEFVPKLFMEVKSGGKRKGGVADFQLHYPLNLKANAAERYGFDFSLKDKDMFAEELCVYGDSAFYYNIVDRLDGISSNDIRSPFAALGCVWGDQHIIPSELVFYQFAFERSRRTGERMEESIERLKKKMEDDFFATSMDRSEERLRDCFWVDLHGNDIRSIVLEDNSLYECGGLKRIGEIENYYFDLNNLKRFCINGPFGTSVYALIRPEEVELFSQIESRIQKVNSYFDKLAKLRSAAFSKLPDDRIMIQEELQLYGLEMIVEPSKGDSLKTKRLYNRLLNWDLNEVS
jgi:hypothetical protein